MGKTMLTWTLFIVVINIMAYSMEAHGIIKPEEKQNAAVPEEPGPADPAMEAEPAEPATP